MKLQARELRIGNWIQVYHKGDNAYHEVEVTGISDDGVIETTAYGTLYGDCGQMIDKCKGILLTGDWMLKFGFKTEDMADMGLYIYLDVLGDISLNFDVTI